MQEEKIIRIRRIYSILLSIMIAIAGVCFMVACGYIYFSAGDGQIYTPDIIAGIFKKIAIPVYLCLAMVIVSFIIEWFIPLQEKKKKPDKPYAFLLQKLQDTKELSELDSDSHAFVLSLRDFRRRSIIIRNFLLAISSLAFLTYALNGTNFDSTDINGSMIRAFLVLCICMVIPFVASIISIHRCDKSMQREIELLKNAPTMHTQKAEPKSNRSGVLQSIQIVGLVFALTLIIIGLFTGGTADVLTKAINICTECIGLG